MKLAKAPETKSLMVAVAFFFILLFTQVTFATETQQGDVLMNFTVQEPTHRFSMNESDVVLVNNIRDGQYLEVLTESDVRLDLMPSTLPPNITDTNTVSNTLNYTGEIVWSAASLVLNNSYATITFLELIDFTGARENVSFDEHVNLSFNHAELNSTNLTFLNTSVEIKIKDVYLETVRILKDSAECIDCTIISYLDNDTIFTAPGFSVYSVDNDTNPSVGITLSRNVTVYNSSMVITGDTYNESYPENVTIDVGNDNTLEENYTGTLSGSQTVDNMTASIVLYNGACDCTGCQVLNDGLSCRIPIVLSSDTQGSIELSDLNISQHINNFTIEQFTNVTLFDLDDIFYDYNNDTLNYSWAARPVNDSTTLAYCSFDTNYLCEAGELVNESATLQKARFNNGTYVTTGQNLSLNRTGLGIFNGTVEFTFIPTWNGNDNNRYILFQMNATGAGNSITIEKTTDNNITVEVIDTTATAYRASSSISHWEGNNSYHIAASWDQNLSLYFDGVRVANDSNIVTPNTFSDYIAIGSTLTNSFHANATFDELKISNGTRTDFYNRSNITLFIDSENKVNASGTQLFGGTRQFVVTANDNRSLTDSNMFNITIGGDTKPPTWQDNNDNSTALLPKEGDTIQLNLTMNDTVQLKSYIFSWNDSGSWVNDSVQNIAGTNYFMIENRTTTASAGSTVGWRVFINDTSNNVNTTDIFTFSIVNTGPDSPTVVLESDDISNTSSYNITCMANLTDFDADVMNVTLRWFRNDTLNDTVLYHNNIANGTWFNGTLERENLTKGEMWECELNITDGIDETGPINSTFNVTIENSPPPQVTLDLLANGATTTNRTPFLNWTPVVDIDGDAVKYNINISCMGGCTSDTRDVNSTTANYTITPELLFFGADGYSYNWSVYAIDEEDAYSAKSALYNFSLQTEVSFNITRASMSFGTLIPGEYNDTDDDLPLPFIIENIGNIQINITLNITEDLWDTVGSPSSYFQFRINESSETDSYNRTESQESYANVPNATTIAISTLNHTDANDEAEIHINITVPDFETPIAKDATITFYGEQTD